jgi:hypothetical protein
MELESAEQEKNYTSGKPIKPRKEIKESLSITIQGSTAQAANSCFKVKLT